MIFLWLALVPLVTYLAWLAWENSKTCSILSKIPGPKSYPIVGNSLQFERESYDFFQQLKGWCDMYDKGIFIIWLGTNNPFVVIYKPEYVEDLLTSQKNITKSNVYTHLHPWLGTGLLTSSGEKWRSRRKLLTSTFHFKILNNFVPIHQKQTARLIRKLKEKADKNEFDIKPYISYCSLDIICETSMGVDISSQLQNDSEYVQEILLMSELIQERQKSPWLWPDMIYNLTSSGRKHKHGLNVLHGFTNKVIDDRIKERKEGKTRELDPTVVSATNRKILAFLDLLLEEYDQGHISKEGVREEVDTFMFEGHDTTAASIAWTIHLLGKHPDVQARLQKEVDAFYESIGEEITGDDLKKLTYLECVLKESLRLFSSVPLFARELSEDMYLGPYHVPKGVTVGVSVLALHTEPDTWSDPYKFDPERFTLENSKGRNPFAYVPFSAGPRNCIGQKFASMEEKVVISSIVRNFHITSTQNTDDIKISADLILKSVEGIWVELKSRIH